MQKRFTVLCWRIIRTLLVVAPAFFSYTIFAQNTKHSFSIKDGQFLYDGKVTQIHSGEMHFARVPAPYWRHRLQMIKAMGLNTVACYVFWNYHETAPGVWDWKTGNHNIREFVKTAAQEGLMVILRPGPYCCAEWEFGGYPWWLQKQKNLVIRTDNKLFLDSCRLYINQLAGQLKDLQVTHGGPIIMVQAENEFGSYVSQRPDIPLATHKKYSAAIRRQLLDAGFNIPMFTSDGSWLFEGGYIEGALPTANGEDNIDNLKKVVNQYHDGKGPYMVAEYYPGWLDHWAEPFERVKTENVVKQIGKYIDNDISFNFYMIHGGTNFGFTAGANYSDSINIQPDLTSYDYDAPISEAGWATPKYNALRELMMKNVKYAVPAVPKQIPVIGIPSISFGKTVNLFDIIHKMNSIDNDSLMTFEDLNQGFGYVMYHKHFNQPISGVMKVDGIADYGIVYINEKKIGELDRLSGKDSLDVNIPFNGTLDILVENMGRINYGARITDNLKGITKPVLINGNKIMGNWQMFKLPMDKEPNLDKFSDSYTTKLPIFYEATFNINQVGDTFLDMEQWGKGIIFVNGINLGRYWRVGPQQTLYLPGCFLKKGKNKIIIFEQQNDNKQSQVSGVKIPKLDKLVKYK